MAFLAAPCAAEIIIVDQNWPYDFNNIQAAINDANDGDYILVFSGTYTGPGNRDIDFLGKAVTVRSLFPDDPCTVAATIIDCNGSNAEPHRGFIFDSNEDSNSVLEGLTIIRTHPNSISCENSSPKIVGCLIKISSPTNRGIYCFGKSRPVITGCTMKGEYPLGRDLFGYGVYCDSNSSPKVTDCTITKCYYGIYCEKSSPEITNCTISYTSCGIRCYGESGPVITGSTITTGVPFYWSYSYGITCGPNSTPKIVDCEISGYTRGIFCAGNSPEITNCTITGNSEGGIYCSQSTSLITDCNITGPSYRPYSGIECTGGSSMIINCTISDNNECGIRCEDSNAIITDCTITNNGHGVQCRNSNATITGCSVINNTVIDDGSGAGISGGSGFVTVTDSTISGNSARSGGGIYSCNGPITNCIITGNSADYGGGGIYKCNGPLTNNSITSNSAGYAGGGLAECDGTITGCTISGNSADYEGGGLYLCDGSLTDCIISYNSAMYYYGGGLSSCRGDINNCSIIGNSSVEGGGIAYCRSGKIINCSLIGNFAELYGGAIGPWGGQIINSTIADNTAGDKGGGLYGLDNTIINSIFWNNTAPNGPQIYFYHDISVAYSDIQSGQADVNIYEGGVLDWGLGNIDIDPCFVQPGFWADINDPNIIVEPNDPNAVWVHGDYHLKSEGWRWNSTHQRWDWDEVTSRCIDAGNPGSPLGDEPLSIPEDPNNEWGQNLRINMGAFGGTAEASIPPYDWALLSDMTNDGISDFNDLQILSSLWLNTGQQLYADFDRDGDIDFFDFARLADDWLLQTSWH